MRWAWGILAVALIAIAAWFAADSPPDRRDREAPPAEAPAAAPAPPPAPERAPPPKRAPFVFHAVAAESEQPLSGVRIETPQGDLLALTGDDGTARVDRDGVQIEFVARRRGYCVVKGWAEREATTRVVLKPGLTVGGRVLWAESRSPVEGARVRVWDLDETEEISGTIVTAADGRFDVSGVQPDHPFFVGASLPGFGTARLRRTVDAPADDLELLLGGGGHLEGTVLDAHGRSAVGLEVWLLRPKRPIPPRRNGAIFYVGDEAELAAFVSARATTDESGRYEFRGVLLERDRVAVVRMGQECDWSSEPVRFTRDGERQRRDVQLPLPARVKVFAKREDGEVEPDVQIDLLNEREIFTRNSSEPQPDGSRVFERVTPARYTLRVWFPRGPHRDTEIELRSGDDRTIEVEPQGGGFVEGTVVDLKGQPVTGASVAWAGERYIDGDTDPRGRFKLTGLDTGPGTLTASHSWQNYAPSVKEDVEPGSRRIRFVLEPGARLEGRVAGLPKGTRRIRCDLYSKSLSGASSMDIEGDGRFELDAPVREPMLLAVSIEGFPPMLVDIAALRPGATKDVGTLRPAKGRTAHGRLVDETAAPVHGAKVAVAEPWTELESGARSGKDGSFRFPLMPPGRALRLRVDAPGHPVHFFVHEIDGSTYALGRGGELDVLLTGADVEYATLVPAVPGFDRDRAGQFFKLDADGRLHARLQGRRWSVEVWSKKKRKLVAREVEVRSGATTDVELRFD